MADALGSKWVLAAGLSCWSLATAFTPLAAANGAAPLLATRLALGLGEGGWVGKITEKNCRKVPSLWKTLNGLPSHHRMNSNSLHRVVLISGSLLGPQINQKISLELSPE